MTTIAEPLVRTDTPQFEATVVAVTDLGGGMRRVTCAAEGLRTFVPCGPDEYVGLLMPPAGRPLVMPDPRARATCAPPSPRCPPSTDRRCAGTRSASTTPCSAGWTSTS